MIVDALVSPEEVMAYAVEGRLSKPALASLLTARARRPFYDACGEIELRFTEACRAQNDPCLESGCSAEGERCLEPVLRAGVDYEKACGAVWAKLFADAANREPSWRVTVSSYEID
jgi:hypothetical protein